MKRPGRLTTGVLAAIVGLAVAGVGGCQKSNVREISWRDGRPRNERVLVGIDKNKYIERSRKFFHYSDERGEDWIEFYERKLPNSNKWSLSGVSMPKDKRLFEILEIKLPRLADVLTREQIPFDEIFLESIYKNGIYKGTRIHLPNGETEEYKPVPKNTDFIPMM